MKNNCSKNLWSGRGLLAAITILAVSGIASAQDKKEEEEVSLSSITSPNYSAAKLHPEPQSFPHLG